MSTQETALANRIEQEITALQTSANAIVVRDQQSYIGACVFVVACRNKIKGVGFELDPGIAKAKESYDHLRNQKAKWVERYAGPIETVAKKAEAWKAEERRLAQVEQDRINEQAHLTAAAKAAEEKRIADAKAEEDRKARQKEIDKQRASGELKAREAAKLKKEADERAEAERKLNAEQHAKTAAEVQPVTVAPAVPKVAGIKGRVNWKFEIVTPALIPVTFRVPDEVAIGQMVRATKDKASAEKQCPGIRVWSEDGI